MEFLPALSEKSGETFIPSQKPILHHAEPTCRCLLAVLALADFMFPLLRPSSSPLHGPCWPPPLAVTLGPEHLRSAYCPQHHASGCEAVTGKVLWMIHL